MVIEFSNKSSCYTKDFWHFKYQPWEIH